MASLPGVYLAVRGSFLSPPLVPSNPTPILELTTKELQEAIDTGNLDGVRQKAHLLKLSKMPGEILKRAALRCEAENGLEIFQTVLAERGWSREHLVEVLKICAEDSPKGFNVVIETYAKADKYARRILNEGIHGDPASAFGKFKDLLLESKYSETLLMSAIQDGDLNGVQVWIHAVEKSKAALEILKAAGNRWDQKNGSMICTLISEAKKWSKEELSQVGLYRKSNFF